MNKVFPEYVPYSGSYVAFGTSFFLSNLNKGSNRRIIAMTVIGPEIGRVKKTVISPLEIKSDCRNAGSAMGPRTIARTAGANG